MNKPTEELLHDLKHTEDILQYLDDNSDELIGLMPHAYLQDMLQIKHKKPAEVSLLSGQGDYVYKVFQGTRKASRGILLAIALGMGLDIDETQLLLRIAKMAQLDPRNRYDSVILYALQQNLSVDKTNEILFDLGESTL